MPVCFQGGFKNTVRKSGGLFQIKDSCGEQQKKYQGGLHDLSENSGGPIVIRCTDQKEAPLNSQRFLLQIFSPKDELCKSV